MPTRRTSAAALPARLPALALLALGLAGCSLTHQRVAEEGPRSTAAAEPGLLRFTVGRLSFDAPAAWRASGDPRRVLLVSPGDDARIDAQRSDRTFKTDAECLARATESLARGAAKLTNVRRHATTLAGRKAVVQEADQGGWHGWAWALCDGGEQYRLFFTGRSPVGDENLRAMRRLSRSAAVAGQPGASAPHTSPHLARSPR